MPMDSIQPCAAHYKQFMSLYCSVFASLASECILLQLACRLISKLRLPYIDTMDGEGGKRINNKDMPKTVSETPDLNTNLVRTGS